MFAFGMKMDEQRFEDARPATPYQRKPWRFAHPLGEESLELMKFGGNMESVTILGGARHDRDLRFKYR
jgi:hypothetical protein